MFFHSESLETEKGETLKNLEISRKLSEEQIGQKSKEKNKFSEEELAKINQAFALSDICTGRTGAIPPKEVVNVVRTLGQCPTQIEVQELIIEVEVARRVRTRGTARGSARKKSRKQKSDPGRKMILET